MNPVCAEINEEVQPFKSDQHKTVVLLNSRETDMTQITSLDSGNIFEIKFVTLHYLDIGDIGIVAHKSGNVDMQQN